MRILGSISAIAHPQISWIENPQIVMINPPRDTVDTDNTKGVTDTPRASRDTDNARDVKDTPKTHEHRAHHESPDMPNALQPKSVVQRA
jgi:hypothetical protein